MTKSAPNSSALTASREQRIEKVGFFNLPRELRDEIYLMIPPIRLTNKPKCIWCKRKKCPHWQRTLKAKLLFDEYPVGLWPPWAHVEYKYRSKPTDNVVRVHHLAYLENPGKLGVSKQFDYELRETLIHNRIFLDMLPRDEWVPLIEDLKRQLTENGEMEGIRRLSMDAPFVFVIEIADDENRELRIRTGRVMVDYQSRVLKKAIQRYLYRPWSRRAGGRLERGGRLHGRHLFDVARIIKKCEARWYYGFKFKTEIKNRSAHSNRLFIEGPDECGCVFMHEMIQAEPTTPVEETPKKEISRV